MRIRHNALVKYSNDFAHLRPLDLSAYDVVVEPTIIVHEDMNGDIIVAFDNCREGRVLGQFGPSDAEYDLLHQFIAHSEDHCRTLTLSHLL